MGGERLGLGAEFPRLPAPPVRWPWACLLRGRARRIGACEGLAVCVPTRLCLVPPPFLGLLGVPCAWGTLLPQPRFPV